MNQSYTRTIIRPTLQQSALFQAFPCNICITVIGESGFTFYSSMPRHILMRNGTELTHDENA